jgi:FkbM family methyltransferase
MPEWWKNEFYSQFGEDSIVMSYFRVKEYGKSKRLDGIPAGFYVDIGAHHPYMISNTWHFYQRGWQGINVEPTPGMKRLFDEYRPRDVNLDVAISDKNGEAILFSGLGVQNTLDAGTVPEGRAVEQIVVPTMRLDTLLDQHLPAGQSIDILSVDVEGLDLTVLRSNDWARYRPEIVIAEQHGASIHKMLASPVVNDMGQWGYELYAWTQPSVIFRRR